MQFHRHLPHFLASVATMGTFDGLHLGHQALLSQLKTSASELDLPSVLITFEPYPQTFFGHHIGRIMNFRDKLHMLQTLGIDHIVCLRFDQALSQTAPQVFIDQILVKALGVKNLIVGPDCRFGYQGAGDVTLLKQQTTLDVQVCAPVSSSEQDERISSTAIRAALADGEFAQAAALLGRDYTLSGRVHHGDKLRIGFPTLNIPMPNHMALSGVFAVEVLDLGDEQVFGVANLGVRPTVDGTRRLLEVHCFNFDRNVYGKHVRIRFLKKIRDERKFDSIDELRQQIGCDVLAAQTFVAELNDMASLR